MGVFEQTVEIESCIWKKYFNEDKDNEVEMLINGDVSREDKL